MSVCVSIPAWARAFSPLTSKALLKAGVENRPSTYYEFITAGRLPALGRGTSVL